ncbi:type 2 DNA topoisomerase 6 subunit B-like [Antechinus flavipes]|uniref:type 2 DNA topoisomerase 6 subunit B-like n=1 Tax=Antechinus flavipes TaxID=38775 RepID=UPI002235E308|nr:type 2 DNA topoisomerase 6 subunit B-like [Antechinus flavipes]
MGCAGSPGPLVPGRRLRAAPEPAPAGARPSLPRPAGPPRRRGWPDPSADARGGGLVGGVAGRPASLRPRLLRPPPTPPPPLPPPPPRPRPPSGARAGGGEGVGRRSQRKRRRSEPRGGASEARAGIGHLCAGVSARRERRPREEASAVSWAMEARAVCEILKYIIIHWKREAAEVSREAFLEGELFISIEEKSSKHRANPFHYVTAIAFTGSPADDFVTKQLLKEIQSLLSGFSGKLTWPSEEARCSQDLLASFQMKFEVDEKPANLMTDCLVIKQFLHKTSIVHPKVRFRLCVKVNGVLSEDTFGEEKEPVAKLLNGIGLLTNQHHYRRLGFSGAQQVCSRIHPVLGHPVALVIPDEEAAVGVLGELTLTPAAALCPCHKLHPSQTSRISTASVFLYGPSGLPLTFPNQEHPLTVFSDNSYLFDWKKYHLCAAPNSNISLEEDVVLPDVSYCIESHHKSQLQDSEEQALLLFLMVDFHSGFPAQLSEAWGRQSLLLTHLNRILLENHSLVQDAVQAAVDQASRQPHRALEARQKVQASIPVAVSSILSVVSGSTNSGFRALCLQTLQAADTQEFGKKLHKAFRQTVCRRFLYPKKLLPEPSHTEEREDREESLEEPLAENCCPGGAPSPKKCCPGEGLARKAQAAGWPPLPGFREATQRSIATRAACPQAKGSGSPETRGEDTLWLQEVSNLSEWLSAGPGSGSGPGP